MLRQASVLPNTPRCARAPTVYERTAKSMREKLIRKLKTLANRTQVFRAIPEKRLKQAIDVKVSQIIDLFVQV